MHRLFVYGTLKRGYCRSGALASAWFIDTAQTEPEYRLVNVGTYPGLVPASAGRAIQGEVWAVDDACLARLDAIEGVAEGLYRREPVRLQTPHDEEQVLTYIYARSIGGMPDCGDCWQ